MPLYFHEMRVFRPSGLKTLNSSTLADLNWVHDKKVMSHAALGSDLRSQKS
jgi:hypothetical protein